MPSNLPGEAAGKLRVGSVPNTSCADKQPRRCSCLFLQGKPRAACLSLPAIPPGTVGLPLRRQSSQSLPGVQGAARRAAGAACVSHPAGMFRPPACPSLRAARHTLRRWYGPSRPRLRRASAFPAGCRSLAGSGSLMFPSPCTAKARYPPTLQTLSGANAPLRSASLVV